MKQQLLLLVIAIFWCVGCGKRNSAVITSVPVVNSATATAHFLNGVTTATGGRHRDSNSRSIKTDDSRKILTVPENGQWLLSPDKVTLTVTSIQLTGGSMDAVAVSCTVIFDLSKPGLTELGDCPFSVPVGTYTGISIGISTGHDVFIDDSIKGFYSQASGIVTVAPADGAESLSISEGTGSGTKIIDTQFSISLTVSSSSTPIINIVVNALQYFKVTVTNGIVTLGHNDDTGIGLPDFIGSLDTLAKVVFYANQALNTMGSYCAGQCISVPPSGITSLVVFYTSATTPVSIGIQLNGTPTNCSPIGPPDNSMSNYFGIDSTRTFGWTIPNGNYTGVEFNMTEVPTIGYSTSLYCKAITSDPAPAGGSFTSGAPDIVSNSNNVGEFILLAQ